MTKEVTEKSHQSQAIESGSPVVVPQKTENGEMIGKSDVEESLESKPQDQHKNADQIISEVVKNAVITKSVCSSPSLTLSTIR